MKFSKFILLAVGALLTTNIASAGLTLDVSGAVSFQQTTNNPCVIGDPSCKEPSGFFYDKESGTPSFNGGSYDLFSSVYVAGAGVGTGDVIPTTFQLGIDENFNTNPEYLVSFTTWVCNGTPNSVSTQNRSAGSTGVNAIPNGSPAADGQCSGAAIDAANSYAGPTTQLLVHNGNGYSDALLSTFNLTAGKFYVFEAKVSSDSDGMEEFFIVPSGTAPTPEPTSVLLLGTMLLSVGKLLHRRLSM